MFFPPDFKKAIAIEAAADPFALSGTHSRERGSAMDRAFASTHELGESDGLPVQRASWVLPVAVGLAALLFGGVVTFAVLLLK